MRFLYPVLRRSAAPIWLVCAVTLLTVVQPASAETISMTFQGIAPGTSVPGPVGGSAGVMQWTGPTGLAQGSIGLFPGLAPQSGININTFCIDPTQTLNGKPYSVVYATAGNISTWDNIQDIGGQTHATELLELFGTFFTGLATANNNSLFGGHGTSVTGQYAAFQDAIWIIEGFTISDTLANYMVNHLSSTEATNVVILQTTATDGTGQSQITVIDPVPAPPGALLALIGFVGVAGYRFRGRLVPIG